MLDLYDSERPAKLLRLLHDRYAFHGLLGRGGAGLVFEAENRQLGRREALKVLHQSLGRDGSKRFVHEARIMASLDHPHIVPIYAFGEDEGFLWYAMKLVEGPTLAGFARQVHLPSPLQAFQIAIPILDALARSHERGIIHRDIKPANLLLDPIAGPLLTDFGIAKTEEDPLRTETGMMLGTPAYVSPEQSLGRTVDGRTDLYALGVTLFQLLTGQLPFGEGNSLSIVLQRFQEEAPDPKKLRPDLPDPLVAILMRALARQPEDRFSDARSMREALVAAAAQSGLDWTQPLEIPKGLGPRREPLPPTLLRTLEGPFGEFPTDPGLKPTPQAQAWHAPTEVRPEPPSSRWRWLGWISGLAVPLVAGGLYLGLRPKPPIPAPMQAAPRPLPPAPTPTQSETPAPKERPKPQSPVEPGPVLRRAVSPPQMREPPRVEKIPDGPCAGRTFMVEVTVDEQGGVRAVRPLNTLEPSCRDKVLQAARTARFTPGLGADGAPVPATVAIAIEF